METERRKFLRKKPPHLIYLELDKDNGGMVLDATEDGIGFRAVTGLRGGTTVTFGFALDGVTRLEGKGEIVWADGSGKTAGLRFTEVSDTFRERMRNWSAGEYVPYRRVPRPPEGAPADTFERLKHEIRAQYSPLSLTDSSVVPPAAASAVSEPSSLATEQAQAPQPEERDAPPVTSNLGETLFRDDQTAKTRSSSSSTPPPLDRLPPEQWPSPLSPSRPQSGHRVAMGTVLLAAFVAGAAVAGFAYRQVLGDSLIWLGQRVSGSTQPSQVERQVEHPSAQTPVETPASSGAAATHNTSEDSGTSSPSAGSIASPHQQENSSATAETPKAPVATPSVSADQAAHHPDRGAAAPPVSQRSTGLTHAELPAAGANKPTTELADDGYEDFDAARAILRSNDRGQNMTRAVRLLWSGVQKGYAPAEVTLADLYQRGDGVEKNCDQARVLLEAATKRGSPEAKVRLDLLLNQGCE
jgi:hypothetical protein